MRGLFSEVSVVEPGFEDVVVVWRGGGEEEGEERKGLRGRTQRWGLMVGGKVLRRGKKALLRRGGKEAEKADGDDYGGVQVAVFNNVEIHSLHCCLPRHKIKYKAVDALRMDIVSFFGLWTVVKVVKFQLRRRGFLIGLAVWLVRAWLR